MTLTDQIAALTEWPKRAEYIAHHTAHGTLLAESADYWGDAHDAALARLALARELAQAGDVRLMRHANDCSAMHLHSPEYPRCSCGRDALLAALDAHRRPAFPDLRTGAHMSLTDQIAALPYWPDEDDYVAKYTTQAGVIVTYSHAPDDLRLANDQVAAALARLALAQKWMKSQPHGLDQNGIDCKAFNPSTSLICTCGRNALLAALEPQK